MKTARPFEALNVFEVTDVDGEGESNGQRVSVFYGALGQLLMVLKIINARLKEVHLESTGKEATTFSSSFENEAKIQAFVYLILQEGLIKPPLRVVLNKKLEEKMAEMQKLMETNLWDFEEQKLQMIEELLCIPNPLRSLSFVKMPNVSRIMDSVTLKMVLKALFQIYFKSVDYKIPEEAKIEEPPVQNPAETQGVPPEAGETEAPADENASVRSHHSQKSKKSNEPGQEERTEIKEGQEPSSENPEGAPNGESEAPPAPPKREYVIPPITENDMMLVKLKEKLQIVFSDQPAQEEETIVTEPNENPDGPSEPAFDFVIRILPALNRETTFKKIAEEEMKIRLEAEEQAEIQRIQKEKIEKEKEEKKKQVAPPEKPNRRKKEKEEEVVVVPQPIPLEPVKEHEYLVEEEKEKARLEKEAEQAAEEEQEAKRKAEHIEQFYGDTYEYERKVHPLFASDAQAPPKVYNQNAIPNKRAILINHMTWSHLSDMLFDLISRSFSHEVAKVKWEEIQEKFIEAQEELSAEILKKIISEKDKDRICVFDFEE